MEQFQWPAQSPDLKPTEHLWDELEHRLRKRISCPTSVPDLTNTLLTECSQIPTDTVQNLVESLPKNVEAVIAAKRRKLINILIPKVVEWDVQQSHIVVMPRCPHTFGNIVFPLDSKCRIWTLTYPQVKSN